MTRVEDVDGAAFTEVMKTRKGKLVRADFDLVRVRRAERRLLTWAQRVEGTPFERVLSSAETDVRLRARWTSGATEVTIELRQTLAGFSPRRGGSLQRSRRASAGAWCAARPQGTLDEALDGLERISG